MGKRVYVAIVSEPGAVDVIDTVSMQQIKTLAAQGGVNVKVPAGQRFFNVVQRIGNLVRWRLAVCTKNDVLVIAL